MDRTLSGATTPGQSGPGSNGNEGLLGIPQSSSITGASPSSTRRLDQFIYVLWCTHLISLLKKIKIQEEEEEEAMI